MTTLLVVLVRLYQLVLSPFLGGRCRYQPSCSQYAIDALRTHDALTATGLVIKRVARCHPWGGFGHDPVPPKTSAAKEVKFHG